MSESKNILIYTDIGDDVDDSLALCYLIEHTSHNIVAIIVSHGDLEYRAAQAQEVCDLYGVTIPILKGSSSPLVVNELPPLYNNEISKQITSLTKEMEQIEILAIGPCTDFAKTRKGNHDYFHKKIAQIIFQGDSGGDLQPDKTSYNFKCDLYAAGICTNAWVPQKYIGRDKAYANPMRANDFENFSKHPHINSYLHKKAIERRDKFQGLNKEKWDEIYSKDPTILSFPYDLMAAKAL